MGSYSSQVIKSLLITMEKYSGPGKPFFKYTFFVGKGEN